jgi:superoxide dismutase, Fe-Mn family
MITRRTAMQTFALAGATGALGQAEVKTAFTLPQLSFPVDALEPHIGAQTLEFHHGRHHAAYVANLNAAVAKHPELQGRTVEELIARPGALPAGVRAAIKNNGGGHANHSFYWNCLRKPGGSGPRGELATAIERRFGTLDKFKAEMNAKTLPVFGSGYGWLVLDENRELAIMGLPDQETPLSRGHVPLLTIDVWEHAYYLDYQNRRADHIGAIWNVVNWDFVAGQYRNGRA